MDIKRNVLSCDVLVVGGGVGGLSCAIELKEQNPELDVLIVEKQFAGYSGKANKGGGVLQYFQLDKITPLDFLKFHVSEIGCYLGDQNLMLKYVEMNHGMLDRLSSWGVDVPKNPDGSYNVMPTGPFTAMIRVDLTITLRMRKRCEKLGVRILDKTALGGLYVKDNRIRGISAYSILDDGAYYTISAKKVVLATGSQNYRFGSMWSSGRGDGIAAAYRAGAEMRNAEFGNFSQLVRYKSHHEVVFGENNMYNAKGEFITKNFTDHRQTDIPSTAVREWYLQMIQGNGPVHLEFGPFPGGGAPEKKDPPDLSKMSYSDKFRTLNMMDSASVDTDLEVVPSLIGEQSCIRTDEFMRTTVDGLYAIGDCSYCGSGAPGAVPAPPGRNRGSGILNAVFAGIVAADDLAVSEYTDPAPISDDEIDASIAYTYAPLNRPEGHDPKEVIHLVQEAMAPSEYSVYMREDRMDEAMKYVNEAAAIVNDLKAVDMHGVLSCHEAECMVLSAQMHYFASRLRKESRGWFLREDYPEMDNENWLKWIIIKLKDGEMCAETEDVPIEKYPVQLP